MVCANALARFRAALVGSIVLASGRARASGFASAHFGGEHGNVTESNPASLYYNPGALGFSSGVHVFADGTLALRRVTWTHAPAPTDVPDPAGAQGANAGRAVAFNVFAAPMLGVSVSLGDLAVGAAFYVPFGGREHWSKNDRFTDSATFPLAGDGVQRWHSIDGALTYVYATAGLAYRLGPLSAGLSGNLIHSSVQSLKAKNLAGYDTDSAAEGRADLDVGGWQGSFAAGALVELIPRELWAGASYQAQPGLGPMRLTGTLTLSYAGSNAPFPVTFDQSLPDIVRLGVRYRPDDRTEFRAFGDMTRWSVMVTQCVALKGSPCRVDRTGADAGDGGVFLNLRRHWRDTFGAHAGASRWLSRNIEGFAGVGFETAAVPDSTLEPELVDGTSISAAVGVRLELPGKWFVSGSYTHVQVLNRDNTGKSELANAALPTRRADGGGLYTQWIGLLDVNVEKEF